MADQQDKQFHYLPTLAAAAPAFAIKGVAGSLAEATIEHTVEGRILRPTTAFGALVREGARSRGLGRAAGGLLGVATAPIFIRGTQLLQSKDRTDRAKGLAMIGGATMSYAGARGFIENFARAKTRGLSPTAAASKGLLLGATRAGYKLPMALATAWSVAEGRKRSRDGHGSKYLMPALAGASINAVSRTIEEAAEQATTKGRLAMGTRLKRLGAAGAGGAAGGLLGGVILAGAVDATSHLMNRGKEKKAFVLTGLMIGKGLLAAKAALAAKGALASAAAAKGLAAGTAAAKGLGATMAANAIHTGTIAAAHPLTTGFLAAGTANGLHMQHLEQLGERATKAAEAAKASVPSFSNMMPGMQHGITDNTKTAALSKEAFTGAELLLVPKALALAGGALTKAVLAKGAIAGAGKALGGSLVSNVEHAMSVGIPLHAVTGVAAGYRNGLAGGLRRMLPERAVTGLEHAYNTARARHFSFGLKEGLIGKSQPGFGASVMANFQVPELMANRQMGMMLGRKLREMPEEQREKALRGIQATLVERPGLLKGTGGEANAITAPMLGGISMALGERPTYAVGGKLRQAWRHAALEKELRTRGLPTELGPLQKEKGYFGRNATHLPMMLAPVVAGAAGVMPHTFPLPYAIGHGAWGGGKNAIVDLPIVHRIMERASHGGMKHGLFPGARPGSSQQHVNNALDVILSPAFTTMDRSVKPIISTLRDEQMTRGMQAARDALGRAADRHMRPKRPSVARIMAPAAAATLGGGALIAAGARIRDRHAR